MTFLDDTPAEFDRHDMEADAELERAADTLCACGHARESHVPLTTSSRAPCGSRQRIKNSGSTVTACAPCIDFEAA